MSDVLFEFAFHHQFGIKIWRSKFNQEIVFFLFVDPKDKSHKDLDVIDLSVPRHAQYLHKAWKRHQDAIYWVDINLAIKNVNTTPQMTRFRGAKVCIKWLQERIDDHNIQSAYKCTIRLKVLKTEFNIGMLCLPDDVARLHDRYQ